MVGWAARFTATADTEDGLRCSAHGAVGTGPAAWASTPIGSAVPAECWGSAGARVAGGSSVLITGATASWGGGAGAGSVEAELGSLRRGSLDGVGLLRRRT